MASWAAAGSMAEGSTTSRCTGRGCRSSLVDMQRRRRQLGQETIGRKQEDGGRRNWTMIDRGDSIGTEGDGRQQTGWNGTDGVGFLT